MKRLTKVLVALAVLLLAAGGAMAIAGAVLGADVDAYTEDVLRERLEKHSLFRYFKRNTAQATGSAANAISASSIQNLNLDLKADELIMRTWKEDTIQITYGGKDSEKGEMTVKGDTLNFTGTRKLHDSEVILYYPENQQFDQVTIKVDAGEVEMEGDLYTGQFTVKIGAGELSASGKVVAEKADLTVGAGEISMDDLTAKSLNGDCGMGALELVMAGAEEEYNYTWKCGLGEISIGGETLASIGGKDEIMNSGANYTMNLNCGLGEIDIEFYNY